MADLPDRFVWLDLEMTGLDIDNDVIIEIATIVTEPDLTIVAEGPVLVISRPDELLDGMDDWNTQQHGASGLTEDVKKSKITVEQAEQETLEFLKKHVNPGTAPMCGNSICMDRRYLYREMPALESYFHYRNLDVSTIKEIARRMAPSKFQDIKKSSMHRALDDIHESIAELKHYYDTFFKLDS